MAQTSVGELRAQRRLKGHHGYVESLLAKPPGELLPYRRLRIGRLMDQYDIDDLEEQYELCSMAINNKWGYARAAGWIIASKLCRSENWRVLKMYLTDKRMGLYRMNDEEYREATSEMHKEWKLRGSLTKNGDVRHVDVAPYLYIHNLVGRGKWRPKHSIAEDARLRLSSCLERRKRSLDTGEMLRTEYLKMRKKFITRLVNMSKHRITRTQMNLEEYKGAIFRNIIL